MGALESVLCDPVTADDELCGLIQVLARPNSVRPVS
jgi:hypothetical protein